MEPAGHQEGRPLLGPPGGRNPGPGGSKWVPETFWALR